MARTRISVCVHCDLDLGGMTLVQGHDTSLGHGQYLCEIISRSDKGVRSYGPDTMWTDGQTEGQTDRVIPIYPPQTLFAGGIKMLFLGSVPVDFLRPKFWVAHTKDDVISILMQKYTYTNMYIIKKIISCRFILCLDITSLFKPYEKSCRRRKVKIEKILTVTYRTLLTKTTNFLKSGGYKICLYLKIISYST